jgi:hypothetical protein
MSESTSKLPARPSLEQLRKQAKELLKAFRAGDAVAKERFQRVHAPGQSTTLADAQHVLAREYAFESWPKLAAHVRGLTHSELEHFAALAESLAAAYSTGNANAIRELNWRNGSSFVWHHEPEKMQQRLSTWFASENRSNELALADARDLVARAFAFENWTAFAASFMTPAKDVRIDSLGMSLTPPFFKINWKEDTLSLRGPQSEKDWDTIIGVMKEHRIGGLNVGGMIDAGMERIAELDQVTRLELEGSAQLTDDGLEHLAGMPQLQQLNIGGPRSRITDRGIQVVRHLPELRIFQSSWTAGITDAGAANLGYCDQLEDVNIMGTPTGDGVIRALVGKQKLRRFNTGKLVTDAGLVYLQQFPVFRNWQGGASRFGLMSFVAEPSHLMLDGPFTSLAGLEGLDGLVGLSFFWHTRALAPDALASLKGLANLEFLGCQDSLCNDIAMRHIATIPRLRMLMGQGSVASDEGFTALSRSPTIEYIWGRECPNLGSRGFAALANMPALRGLAVSCRNVDDAALSALPRFPRLQYLMPMDVSDAGFRHVGQCEQLEALWCMYCRDTGDTATEHLAGLKMLKHYYAGATQITDRSLRILGQMQSLEKLEFWECAGITDAGIAMLPGLPQLREISLSGSPRVTRDGMAVFPATVWVDYS